MEENLKLMKKSDMSTKYPNCFISSQGKLDNKTDLETLSKIILEL